ncbi:MAG: hypothetical protein WBD20_00305 [Pirellulaceae bacterium]
MIDHLVSRGRMVAVHCVVQLGILLTLTWKWTYFKWSDNLHDKITLADPFFPDWLESAQVVRYAYLIALAVIAINIVSWNKYLTRLCNYVTLGCLSILLVHQASYNDATFTTAWWACVWSVWYGHHMDDPDRIATLDRGAFLSRAMMSMVLLGGAVGKWTPEYWNGDVLYDIYFRDRDFWMFNYLRNTFEPEQLRTIATWYSRKVVAIETICGFGLWLLPPRLAALIGLLVFTSIAMFSNIYLFSVMFALIGIAAVGLFVVKRPTHKLDLEA